ncbi:MAG: hypothetical protein ACXVPL_08145, partial [Actinomycetota bacterium]
MRFAWVPLLLAPAGVVFVATRTTVDPIARTERIEVPHIAAAITLPGIAMAGVGPLHGQVKVTVHVQRRVRHVRRQVVAHKPRPVVVPSPRPVYVITRRPAPIHIVIVTKPAPVVKPVAKPKPKPKPTPA